MLVSAVGRLGTQQWPQPGWPWWVKVYVTESVYTLICATMATLFMCLLSDDGGDWEEADWYPQNGSSYLLDYSAAQPLVSVHLGHKYLQSFCPVKEVYSHTSSPGFLVTNFPIMFLPSL